MVDAIMSTVCGGESGGDNISSPIDAKDSSFILEHEKSSSLHSVQGTDVSLQESVKRVLVKVKEEEVDDTEEDDIDVSEVFGDEIFNELSSPLSSSSFVKPMEGLHEPGPPPFLKKIFEIVEDPETESIVSWSKSLESFVVWDSHEFSKTLLPKYFKHSNFSSFIRQLNTYGFRKIDPDRWEFAHEGFKGGKKHLLKNIKRRSRYNKRNQQGAVSSITSVDPVKPKLEAQLENLKSDHDFLRVEIHKLRQQQEDSQNRMSAVEERIRAAECKLLQMFIFISKATRNPGFIQQLLLKRKRQGELEGGEFLKKRRLLHTKSPENLPDNLDNKHSVECRNQAQEQLTTMQNELAETLPDSLQSSPIFEVPMTEEFCTSIHDDTADVMCATAPQELPFSAYNLISDDLFDDNSAVSNSGNEGRLDVNDSKFYLELEDLIGKSKAWGGSYVTELLERASCI